MKKIISLFLTVFMLLTLSACGGNVPSEDTEPTDTNSTAEQINYSQKKFNTYSENGDYFFSTTEIPTFIDGNAGIRLSSLNSKFSFSADCEGDVTLGMLTKAVSDTADIATLKVYVDDLEPKTSTLFTSSRILL